MPEQPAAAGPAKKLMPRAELETRPGDEELTVEQLLGISIFQGVQPANLARYPGSIILRRYNDREVVFHQGDPGWTAFYILKTEDVIKIRESQGDPKHQEEFAKLRAELEKEAEQQPAETAVTRAKALVSIGLPRIAKRASSGLFGWLRRSRGAEPSEQFIPIDGPVDLEYRKPFAVLNEGELFGELSCMNAFPRSATVTALEDCYVLEMLRNILELLQKNKAFKDQMDAVYRARVLETHLRNQPLFHDLPREVLADLKKRVELIEKQPGEAIFQEGDPSDAMYVIRLGVVKVSRKSPGGHRVLAYCSRGEYIGEMGLFHGEPRNASCVAWDHPSTEGEKKRRAGRVELVRISKELFDELTQKYPDIRQRVGDVVARRTRAAQGEDIPIVLGETGRFGELGLGQGQNLMLIDLDRCTRCDECVRGCAATHEDGRARLVREGPRIGKYLVPSTCRKCLDPVCMIGCPVGSIHKGETGEIQIEDWCIGCGLCAAQCPYDAILMHELPEEARPGGQTVDVTKRAAVCDQCAPIGGIPSCVYSCPHDAAVRVNAQTFFAGALQQQKT